jgi:serine protease
MACAVVMIASGHGQGRAAFPLFVNDVGLPGIDRGLRANDAPPEPRQARRWDVHRGGASSSAGDSAYLRGSIIVKFRDTADSHAIHSAMRVVGGAARQPLSYADFDIVQIPADQDPEAAAAMVRELPNVEYAQPRYRHHAMARPNDPLYNLQWNFPAIDMERAWDVQPQAGSEIIVAVLDSGVAFRTGTMRYNSTVPCRFEFGGPIYPAMGVVDVPFAVAPELGSDRFVAPRDFIWDNDLPFDLDGHGTHVTGTLGQLTNNNVGVAGMAYNVRIMPVKVLDEIWDCIFESPFFATDDTVARGVRYAVDNGARVINMSFGRSEGGPATAVTEAIRYAVSRGAFVAVSGGNTALEGNSPGRIAQAAPSIDGMMAVAAVGRNLQRASYSTTNSYIEIAAPGGDFRFDSTAGILQQTLDLDLLNTWEFGPQQIVPPRADSFAYYYFQGTSMATPHVSALAAMLMQQGITSPAAIEAAIKQFARDLGRAGVDNEYGYGLIQPRTTLRGLGLAK